MGIQTATTYLIPSGLGVDYLTQTRQQRTDQHHRTAQLIAFLQEVLAGQIGRIQVPRREGIFALCQLLHRHAHRGNQVDQVVHIQYVGQVVDHHRLAGQQRGTQHLQRLVLCTLWRDTAVQLMSSFYYKTCHIFLIL